MKRVPDNIRIYGHPEAGAQAYALFEELAEMQSNYSGEVYIRRTLRDEKPGNPLREYPPVYEVYYEPNFWKQINRTIANRLFDIGDRYGCAVHFVVKDNHAVAMFRDGGRNFGGN